MTWSSVVDPPEQTYTEIAPAARIISNNPETKASTAYAGSNTVVTGQSFTTNSVFKVRSAKVYMGLRGSPTVDITGYLYPANSIGIPIWGSPLATSTNVMNLANWNVDVEFESGLTESAGFQTFLFEDIELEANASYVFLTAAPELQPSPNYFSWYVEISANAYPEGVAGKSISEDWAQGISYSIGGSETDTYFIINSAEADWEEISDSDDATWTSTGL